ncbi:MAG: GNAT family N-acetyltransferase [Clostridia bacterium]|nr:GNAT family N-acetyltransferase [Clostridia bacterium]
MDIRIIQYIFDKHDDIIKITESSYLDIFNECSSDSVKIIYQNNIPVGWLKFEIPESSLYDGFIFIYISPTYRRKGIGSYVYKEMIKEFQTIGCDWWSSYPALDAAEKFASSVGFNVITTNSELEHNGSLIPANTDGIRMCTIDDYPEVPNLWSKEYRRMHTRLGYPSEETPLTEDERREQFDDFCQNVNNYFVLEAESNIVGMGCLFSNNSGIGSLAVDHEFSGKGYGTKLAMFLTNECIRRGNPHPVLSCEGGNDNALHIYKKIGYSITKTESVAIHCKS